MMTLTSTIFDRIMPGLLAVFEEPDKVIEEWRPLFKTMSSEKAFESILTTAGLAAAERVPEASMVPMGTIADRYKVTVHHQAYGRGFTISRQAFDDNLYKNQTKTATQELKEALAVAKNIYAFELFNRAWDTTFPWADGKPLASDSHDTLTSTYSNTLTSGPDDYVDFSTAGLGEALTKIEMFPAQNGSYRNLKARLVLISPKNRLPADRIFGSQKEPSTFNNASNPFYNNGYLPEGYVVSRYLTNPDAYYVLSTAKQGLIHFNRNNPEFTGEPNNVNKSMQFVGWERYSFMAADPQAFVASQGV